MISVIRMYGKIAKPWLIVVVYLWVLELFACFAVDDPEPLFDRLADCSAILATLGFWICVAALLPWLIAFAVNREAIVSYNGLAVRAMIVLVTALYFLRWLLSWAPLLGQSYSVVYVLVGVCLLLAGLVFYRRKHGIQSDPLVFELDDGWFYFARPILVAATIILGVKVGSNFWLLTNNRLSLAAISQHRPNVVILVSDALRAQNMSLYGYSRKTTPFLDRFAGQSTVFTQMHSNSTSTRTSLTTLLSGKHPLSHGRLTKFLPIYDGPENLVALLRDNGYTTAAVTSNVDATFYDLGLVKYLVYGEHPNFRRLTLSFLRDNGVYSTNPGTRMYDQLAQFFPFLGYPDKAMDYASAESTLDLAARLLAGLPEPFFLFVHLHEPHNPYEAPAPFRGRYAKMDYRAVNEKISSDYYARYKPELQPFVDVHRDHYDEAIEYLDSELAKMAQKTGQSPRAKNLLWILTGDHGESFERGFLNHGEDLYESSIHVPLIIKFPNQSKGERLSNSVQSIDIAPTVLYALGIAVPKWMDGVPLGQRERLDEREAVTLNYKDPVGRKIYDRPTKLAIRWRQFKLIVSCDANRGELYNLNEDPGEQKDLSTAKPAMVQELWTKAEQHLASQRSATRMECPLGPST